MFNIYFYNYLKKIKHYCKDKEYRTQIKIRFGVYNYLTDEAFLKKIFKKIMGKPLNLDNPITFNEKLQWLKLHDGNPKYIMLVDKYAVKEYISQILGDSYVIPTLGLWKSFDDIDFDSLPSQFVLKCNHDSGGVIICRDKSKLNLKPIQKAIKRSLKRNFYMIGREWPYKDIPRKIFAEKFIEDKNHTLNDYKFFCFDGYVDNVMIVAGRDTGNPRFYHFNREWKLCRYNRLCRSLPEDFTIPKPSKIDEMFEIAEKLSKGFPHVRIDLYCVDDHIYFGEYTLYNQSGFETGFDNYSDTLLGSFIRLPLENE